MQLIFEIQTDHPLKNDWMYFWSKTVTGFSPKVHCARCLKGSYMEELGLDSKLNEPFPIQDLPEGSFLYLCGVAKPYKWSNNFHLAMRVKAGSTIQRETFRGTRILVTNAEELTIEDKQARARFPEKAKAYLTCRNFQFGAQYF